MTNSTKGTKDKVIVVGAGPVGSMIALLLSRRGYHIDIYDTRRDIRKDVMECRRNVNFVLSLRGMTALKHVGLGDAVHSFATPIHSRCIHITSTKQVLLPFGRNGEFRWSASRLELTRRILSEAEKSENIATHFQHKLIQTDPAKPSATFKKPNGETTLIDDATVLFGCDGAHSTVRGSMLRNRMDFKQTYIEHGLIQLNIPATKAGDYPMNPNYFHVWPRKDMLLIAVPNLDKSFTSNLYMPFSQYDDILSGDDIVELFQKNFSDVLPLMGKEYLKEVFFISPPRPLVTIHCNPYHYRRTSVILGDAAHAMLPFAGQGVNCGLEGALIFDEIMEELDCDFAKVLPKFSAVRVDACHVVADYSMQTYIDLWTRITSPRLLLRNKLDGYLKNWLPNIFRETDSVMTFTRIPYHKIIQSAAKRQKAVDVGVIAVGFIILSFCVSTLWHFINAASCLLSCYLL